MEKELNIAAILKDKPTETKLWSPMLGDCIYCYNNTHPEEIIIAFTDKNGEEKEWTFSYSGRIISAPDTADVCLFPSKQMQDWSKFAWKKGDVLADEERFVIFKGFENDDYTEFFAPFEYNNNNTFRQDLGLITNEFRKVNDYVAREFIGKVEEHYGGKLNLETLEIEHPKQEFKDGDIVAFGESVAIYKKFENDELYFYACIEAAWGLILSDSVNTSLEYRLATDSEKQQLFSALAKEGKAWDAEKKQIVDLKPKVEFKPFDKVLVRNTDTEEWFPGFFEKFDITWNYPYHIMNRRSMTDFAFKQCIPYEGNEHLLGTTKDVEG